MKKNTKRSELEEEKDESSDEEKKKLRFPGKPKGSNGGGIKLPEPDEIKEHQLDTCPISGKKLGNPIGYRIKTIIDFPDKPIKTIEHRFMKYISPETGEIIEAEDNLPNNIYGKNLQNIVVMLKNLTNSHDKIMDFIRELGAPSFSSRTVQNIAARYICALDPIQKDILAKLKKESYLHSDETGFRKDGKNGYVWGIFTKTKAIFLAAQSRAAIWFKKLIKGFKGVIIVDGYGGYDYYPLKQRCWAHLMREFKDYAQDNKEIGRQYKRIKSLYENLKILNQKPPDEKEIEKAKWMLKDIITCLKPIKGTNKLRTYIENGGDDWFTALYYESVPLHNNHAERELRSVVLLRKTIGCYRNWKGKRWIDVVMSVIHTWKLQGQNVFHNLKLMPT
ncbi:MAG: IS66 family transposase [Chitinivibrionales bacterium]|nr:IS66 family transposase [Chitinivibrionales bacterium]